MARTTFCLLLCLSLCFFALGTTIDIYESDFAHGTYIIDQPGHYRLMEDVTFNPNSAATLGVESYESGDVLMSQYTFMGGKYDPAAFGVGFFAAIAISADNVILDLNGKLMVQSKEHALQQRFYAHIETADQPFMPVSGNQTQGPFDFGAQLVPARNLIIRNGVFGRTSHHAIHGNNNVNVTLENLRIYDYEVAGIALNGVIGLTLRNVALEGSRFDTPVLGLFSAARFIRPFVNWLVATNSSTTLTVQGTVVTPLEIQQSLRTSLNRVFEDVIIRNLGKIDKVLHPQEYALFHNRRGIVDGNSYGILLNRPGVAVNGFPFVPEDPASYVSITNVLIANHASDTHEIPALRTLDGKELVDPVGSVIQVFNTHPDTHQPLTISNYGLNASYVGNVVTNAQALVGKAILAGEFANSPLGTRRSKFNERVLNWIATPNMPLSDYTDDYPMFCNGDTMFHVSKGVIAMKMDAAYAVSISNVQLSNITNYGPKGIEGICPYTKTTKSNYQATTPGYEGADCRGFSFSGSENITVTNVVISGITAYGGSAYGFDAFTDSKDIHIQNSVVSGVSAGVAYTSASEFAAGPTRVPEAFGFHSGANSSYVHLNQVISVGSSAIGPHGDILLLGDYSTPESLMKEVEESFPEEDRVVNLSRSSAGTLRSVSMFGIVIMCILSLFNM